MWQKENNLSYSNKLISWYKKNKRDLPWRKTTNPYHIWISEIILQQTRVAQGWDYYLRFIERFPDISSLARAEEDDVLKLWQGLGYYSRARNLQSAAKDIMTRFHGQFPESHKDILSLKGIGEYTAAAVSSIVWDQPYPVVDGNVYRVLSRLFGIDLPIDSTQGKKYFYELAGSILDKAQPGIYNQAIMEFGALQCVPRQPDCVNCPLQDNCVAYAANQVGMYPVKQNKTKTRNRYFSYLYIICKETTWLNRRGKNDIWTGLYEFPLIESDVSLNFSELQKSEIFRELVKETKEINITYTPEVKHILSHQIIHATLYKIEVATKPPVLDNYLAVALADLEKYAVPRLIQLLLEKLEE
ncbi:A/G-specific adenine glycosylase [Parabacteroides sp. OttesenSCG-928-G07]|nr:A/G-specific adenine glycosylase [Parabacteroides sp. OttesenSCG-928-G21]MDL2277558.1 A/G-specific adenine glycosylase [Parabacteroides sp. OttesenSCG-928-G07]